MRDTLLPRCAAVLVQRWLPLDVPQFRVDRVRAVLGAVAAELAGRPAEQLRLVAVTGTNGKTTTSLLLHAACCPPVAGPRSSARLAAGSGSCTGNSPGSPGSGVPAA